MFIRKLLAIFILFISILPTHTLADNLVENAELDNFISVSNDINNHAQKEPQTNSKHIIALDRKTLTVMYEKDAYSEVPMASTTKIMTAIIVLENCDLNETVEFSKEAANTSGSCLEVSTGTQMSMNDVLYGLMLRSGNDCAVAISEHIAGSIEGFAELMNNKAKELNLTHTHFVTPHGLDNNEHYTTAYELAVLTDYALKNEKFTEIVGTKIATISINGNSRNIYNTNELLGNLAGVYGVKTGFTFNAGRCLVSACKQNNMDIIVVVLGADTKNQRTHDSVNVINYILNNFEYVDLSTYIKQNFDISKRNYEKSVILQKTTTIPEIELSNLENCSFPLKHNSSELLEIKFYALTNISSNLKINDKIGCITLYYNNQILCTNDIYLKNEIKHNTWYYYFGEILKNLVT